MAVNSSTNPLYTWESFKGDLSLYDHNGKYSLNYKSKDNNNLIAIPLKNVSGISLEKLPTKVDEFCQNYFFKEKKMGMNFRLSFLKLMSAIIFRPQKIRVICPKPWEV